MNKPKNCKIIMSVDNLYCKNLLRIFDNSYGKNYNLLYNRPNFFKKVECDFVVNRFKIENKIIFNNFIKISKNLLDELINSYGPGKFWNIQIAKMQGGGVILPHTDDGLGFVFSHRIHIPLVTNKNVIFKIKDKEFYLSTGNVYEINNLEEHSVLNKNDINWYRIHLILDYISCEYIPFIQVKEKSKLSYF